MSSASPSSRTTAASAPIRSRTGALTRRASASISGSALRPARPSSSAATATRLVADDDVDPVAAELVLELRRRALGDHAAVVDDRDPVGELVGLLEVLGGQQHGRPFVGERPHGAPHLVAPARVQARRRLVEEQDRGGEDKARGEVQPAPHPARVLATGLAPASARPKRSSSSSARAPRARDAEVVQPPEQDEVLPTAEHLVDGGALPDEPDPPRTPPGRARRRRPRHGARPPSARSSVVRMRTAVVLPAPFGPEQPAHGPGRHGEIDPGQRLGLAEPLAQSLASTTNYLRTPYGVYRTRYGVQVTESAAAESRNAASSCCGARRRSPRGAQAPARPRPDRRGARSRSPTTRASRRCRCARSPSAWASGRCRSTRTCRARPSCWT